MKYYGLSLEEYDEDLQEWFSSERVLLCYAYNSSLEAIKKAKEFNLEKNERIVVYYKNGKKERETIVIIRG